MTVLWFRMQHHYLLINHELFDIVFVRYSFKKIAITFAYLLYTSRIVAHISRSSCRLLITFT